MVKRLDRAAAAALVLLFGSVTAEAAGLGRLTVLSDLGQPFRAEIELVSVKKDELSSLKARLATPDAFRQADLPFTAYVSGLRISVENRPSGEPYVKVVGPQPLNEPFIDFLIELNSSGGRIVRSYTALVDPPPVGEGENGDAAKVKPAAPEPEVKPEPVTAKPAPAPAAESPARSEPAPEPAPREAAPPADRAAGVEAPAAGPAPAKATTGGAPAGEYGPVKRGDTLGKIARAVKPADVTLEQMLVLLYRANPDAFIGKNMNLLKSGKVLRVPDAAEAAELTPQAATKEVKVQAANWKAYREKLAAAAEAGPAMEEPKGRSAAGKTTTALEEKAPVPAEPPKEVLKLSKGAPVEAGQAAASKDKSRKLEEEVTAKSKAVAESNQRIAQLEKQLKDMQALAEMKSKGLADAQKPAPAPVAPVPPPKAVEPPKPAAPAEKPLAVGPKPMAPEKPVEDGPKAPAAAEKPLAVGPKPLETGPKPVETGPKPLDAGPKSLDAGPRPPEADPKPLDAEPKALDKLPEAAPPVTAEAPKPEAPPAPPPPPKKPYSLPPPPPEPSLLEQILGGPLVYVGGGLVALALAGFGYTRWKRKKGESAVGLSTKLAAAGRKDDEGPSDEDTLPVGLAAAGAAAAAVPGQPSAEESDALAEAEVFLIYGRDAQAEERLKEAITVTPDRFELHAKLLEIYAKRNDPAAFEQVAKELQIGTSKQSELWDNTVRLGYQIDPTNPRYAAGRPEDSTFENTVPGTMAAESTVQMPAFDGKPADDLDFNLDFDTTNTGSATDIDLENLGAELGGGSGTSTTTDIDLGLLGGSSEAPEIVDPSKTMASTADALQQSSQVLAFDPTATLAPPDTGDLPTLPGVGLSGMQGKAPEPALDLDLGLDADNTDSDRTVSGAGGPDELALSFDLDTLKLDSPPLAGEGDKSSGPSVPDLDLSTISLNLSDTESTVAPTGRDEKWYDVQTKFDLAKAYQEMGDKDGAREILQEVIAEGDAEQKSAAEKLMSSLG